METDKKEIPPGRSGLGRIRNALFYSLDGLRHGIRNEPAIRQEALLSCILIPGALLLPFPAIYKLILIITNTGVLITELLNSAIESVVDKVCPEYDPLAKQAKDMGSAAVLLSLILLTLSWLFALHSLFFQ
ncbi:diacylglycerol kinase [Desulfonema ishimotonii]|uniref:Diacylglycerol kinase n=1 Tax=Desulfonema ishimotonii TaxID=45657 RepID=A0A401FV30_9BACT|nr:diacylglycerol kinase [Desulfonema ishimotonii]GBC60808.1 diacylglycerol kinase [Desulfonema ishimotonii]